MKRRLLILATFLVFVVSLTASLFPHSASAATSGNTYNYTNDSTYAGIQGPDPYANGGQSSTVTYQKADDSSKWWGFGNGIYVDINQPINTNGSTTCYPAIQTSDKKYDGAKTGKVYEECGNNNKSKPASSGSQSVNIGSASNNPYQNQQAQQECQGQTGQNLQACTAGYTAGANGGDEGQACSGFSGDALTECHTAYNDGQGGSSGDTSATCEASGFNLSWILCPFFDVLSDGASWMFSNIVAPFLVTPPVSTDPGDPSFQIWSNIRVYGDIFLVIALLVIVFGESIGGGLIDAYTAKKVLPRLLVAAVLINLSIYIVALLVDISNVLGQGVGSLLTAPLSHCSNGTGGNCWDFNLSLGDQARVFSVGLIGLLAGGTAAVGFLGTLIFGGAAGVSAIITVAFFTLLPMFFAVLAVFVTLIVRKGLILMLVLISPVAFALYCLPNTERFFKRWWDLLIEALMVYPIIVAIFGVAEILSITILTSNGIGADDLQGIVNGGVVTHNLNRTLALVVAFLLQFLPLLAVPFAFRFASGALGRIYEAATGAGARVNQLAESRREHAKQDYQAQSLEARGRVYHNARAWGEKNKGPLGIGRAAGRFVGRRAGGYNIEGLLSASRAEKMKQLEDQIATGRDEEIRGLTVNKAAALRGRGVRKITDANGNTRYEDMASGARVSESDLSKYDYQTDAATGVRSFQSLGGAWITEQDVDAGHSRWGRDQFAQQGALSYEMRKAVKEDQVEHIAQNYATVAKEGWGMSDEQAGGAWIGASFANQGQHVEFKNTDWKSGQLKDGGKGFVDEVFDNKSAYDLSRMNSHTIEQLRIAHRNAKAVGDEETMRKTQSIAETFMQRYGGGGRQVGVVEEGDQQRPVIQQQPLPPSPGGQAQTTGAEGYQTNSQGSAHLAERVRQFAEEAGVYRPLDISGDTHSAGPPPINPRHN
ncbi:MAG TPA: hypothetical protein VHC21_00805 [Candidatus Saccharimonadales bacterium]|nr:hypothetical protein [Candidatus Saccharimonadales bacterium]